MRVNLLIFCVFLFAALSPTRASGDAQKPYIALEAEIQTTGAKQFSSVVMQVWLVGLKDSVVVTEGLSASIVRDEKSKKVVVVFSLPEVKDQQGRLIIPSASRLGIVQLRAGEVAAVSLAHRVEGLSAILQEARDNKIELTVEYHISDLWAKRFGVMGGKYSAVVAPKK
ncbi:hypothetical protein R5W24_004009 [Gemmata sp. JC717]|uniref:hypothetical protein n=1 Tax=Gemmata algarum TaxID=2975278 RepID=UPI0021BAC014|nr:hypothetical protein [Gemmata algarum]MDY3554878.1 hypothetical protein [Gemmata algarum]